MQIEKYDGEYMIMANKLLKEKKQNYNKTRSMQFRILATIIFAMLTMLNVSGAFDFELYEKRRQKKLSKNK